MLEEEDDGLIEDEDEIDQFNDDTFGAGAIGKKETSFFYSVCLCCLDEVRLYCGSVLSDLLDVRIKHAWLVFSCSRSVRHVVH